jgi:hypothetical protein
MAIDASRRPDNPPPPQPKPPQPNPDAHKDWQSRHEQNMKRPERSPEARRGADQQPAPRQLGAIDNRQLPGSRPDQAARPGDKPRPSFDLKRGQAERVVVPRTMDADQYRQDQKGPVNLERVRTDFAKQAAQVGDAHRAGKGAVVIDVRLKNAAVDKGSEGMAIERTLRETGRKENVHVRVSVERNGALYKTDGTRLTPPRPPVPPPDPGTGGPERKTVPPKQPGPHVPGRPSAGVPPPQPGTPQPPVTPRTPGQPGGPYPAPNPGQPPRPQPTHPPERHVPVPPRVHVPPPDIHRR